MTASAIADSVMPVADKLKGLRVAAADDRAQAASDRAWAAEDRVDAVSDRARLAAISEESPDAVVIVDYPGLRVTYANAAFVRDLGWAESEIVGRSVVDVVAGALDPATIAGLLEVAKTGRPWVGEADRRLADGTLGRVQIRAVPRLVAADTPDEYLMLIHDVTELRRGENERSRLVAAVEQSLDGVVITDLDLRIVYANRAYASILSRTPPDLVGQAARDVLAIGLDAATVADISAVLIADRPWFGEVERPDSDGTPGFFNLSISALHDANGDRTGWLGVAHDLTEHHRAELEMRRLSAAIEHSADSVMITDATGAIEYVNPAFEKISGYSRDEVLGQNPRILKSGVQDVAFYGLMWATLKSGSPFSADITNRRKDGTLYQEESVVSPIRNAAGTVTSYVAVKRDVTRSRASESIQQRLARDRAIIAAALAELQVLPTPAATAAAICRQVLALGRVSSASLAYFTLEGPVLSLAFERADGVPVRLRALPLQRSQVLRERADEGPWVETWVRRPWHPYDRLQAELRTTALAYAPVRVGGRLIGLLTVTSEGTSAIAELTEYLPALLDFAGFAGALVGPAVAELTEVGHARERIALTIKKGAFRPVFQPVVDLMTGSHIGYEALTRFSSGTPPDLVFADARGAGLEAELELVTLAAAIEAAHGLPAGAWLGLNVSPSLITAGQRLAGVLRMADRPVVVEVTEHVAVDDYAALRAALAKFRPRVRVAVDDAGSGVANFSHIVELRPAFVKLDIGLVRGIDTDLTRRALMVGLLHFAAESASQTIAEGVETEEEFAMLQALGVPLAQGYLLGRPAPVAEWTEQVGAGKIRTARNRAASRRRTSAAARVDATAERVKDAALRDEASADRQAKVGTQDPAARLRDEAAGVRDDAADARDAIADTRDDVADARDAVAGARDSAGTAQTAGHGVDHDAGMETALAAAYLDDLTGLYRRGQGRLVLAREIDRARRGDGRFVLAFVDVDALKAVNDRDGHAAGDRVLVTLAASLRSRLRSFDPIVRYGGDEFVCGLGGIDLEAAERRFEVIDQDLRAALAVGLTVGFATLAPDETMDEIIARADAALLSGKRRRAEAP